MSLGVLIAARGDHEKRLVESFGHRPQLVTVVRRCADLAEVLATAESGQGQVAVIASTMPFLDREFIARLAQINVVVVLLEDPPAHEVEADDGFTDELESSAYSWAPRPAQVQMLDLGADLVIESGVDAAEVVRRVIELARARKCPPTIKSGPPRGSEEDNGAGSSSDRSTLLSSAETHPASQPGRLVAVWGPTGAPGRTTVAVNLAAELATLDPPVLLIDADTYAGSVAMALGLLDESPGLVAAVRAALREGLDGSRLQHLSLAALPGLHVLTGIDRSARWPELRLAGLECVWQQAREYARWVIVDCGFCLEQDEVLSFDTRAPERNGATISALRASDQAIVVSDAEPAGLVRLCHGLEDLAAVVGTMTTIGPIVVNRVRASVDGPRPRRSVERAVEAFTGRQDVRTIPDDPDACDRAVSVGKVLHEVAPESMTRADLRSLALELVEFRDHVDVTPELC